MKNVFSDDMSVPKLMQKMLRFCLMFYGTMGNQSRKGDNALRELRFGVHLYERLYPAKKIVSTIWWELWKSTLSKKAVRRTYKMWDTTVEVWNVYNRDEMWL